MNSDRIYLSVPFANKDQAKAMMCRWDADSRMWYCTSAVFKSFPSLARWLPPGSQHGQSKPDEVSISPSMEMLRRLIQLCHPDKHQNSQASMLATQYLLSLKSKH